MTKGRQGEPRIPASAATALRGTFVLFGDPCTTADDATQRCGIGAAEATDASYHNRPIDPS